VNSLRRRREQAGISHRNLASLAGVSYKTIQLLESGRHDPKISTLQSLASALGYPPRIVERRIESLWRLPSDSVAVVSERIVEEGEDSWKIWLFNFVDAFRYSREKKLIETPPVEETPMKIKALLASTVETLCAEMEIPAPSWYSSVPPLEEPWFVSGMESLKAMALVESPVHFRKRNIFVLKNFLERR
jgi:transcriptional regulator with XRE-family HTH domain